MVNTCMKIFDCVVKTFSPAGRVGQNVLTRSIPRYPMTGSADFQRLGIVFSGIVCGVAPSVLVALSLHRLGAICAPVMAVYWRQANQRRN